MNENTYLMQINGFEVAKFDNWNVFLIEELINVSKPSTGHILCNNDILTKYRSDLSQKLIEINLHWSKLKFNNVICQLLLANDMQASFYFGIFLEKLFKLIKDSYSKKY